MCASNLEKAVHRSIEFIRSRHHPEKPHISVLSPPHPRDYALIWSALESYEGRYDEVEGDEDELLEDFEESLRSRWPGWLFGSDFELGEGGEQWCAETVFSFYVRVRPDFDSEQMWDNAAYTQVLIHLKYCREPPTLEGMLSLVPGEDSKVESRQIRAAGADFIAVVIVPQAALSALNRRGLEGVLRRAASVGLRALPSVRVEIVPVPGSLLSAEYYDVRGNRAGDFHHAFCVLAGCAGNLFKAYLINLGGVLESGSRLAARARSELFKTYTYNPHDGLSRWALGYLFEVEGFVKFIGKRALVGWNDYGLVGAHPINALVLEKGGDFVLRDYCVVSEELPPIKKSQNSAAHFLSDLARRVSCVQPETLNAFMQALSGAIADALNVGSFCFYTYQERAIEEILASLGLTGGQGRRAIAITARTAGGKTLAFLVPILVDTFLHKLHGEERGVKAILAYPTKALANDQTEEVAALLFRLSERLLKANLPFNMSFGCLHGSTYDLEEVRRVAGGRERPYLPVKCPIHGQPVYVEEDGGRARARCPSDESCSFALFLNRHMRKTREEVYYDPPDILITDEDMLNRIISGAPKDHRGPRGSAPWYEWQLLGYPYIRCRACLHTYPSSLSVKRCIICGADITHCAEYVSRLSKIRVIVLDEAHQIYGSFGIQVHHMLSLLEHVLGYKPLYVLASATLARADDFASRLLNLSSGEVEVIGAETDVGQGQLSRRIFAIIMPKAYTMDATAARLLTRFYSELLRLSGACPKGIAFTNTLAENNELLLHLRSAFAESLPQRDVRIDGHSTDYERERAKKELQFKGGEIDLFVATSTLELGIDYGVVDFVAIYGVPAKVSSFVQRVGRAGRNRDAAIFVIFDPESPLNHSHYESYKILCEGALRDRAIAHEVIEISPINEEAIRRSVRRWAVSEVHRVCAQKRNLSKVLVNGLSNNVERRRCWDEIANHILSTASLPQSLQNPLVSQQVLVERSSIAQQISSNRANNWPGISKFVEEMGRDFLYNLRAADEEVIITYSKLSDPGERTRRRELRYAIKHCLPGQVTSYRGLFFTVYEVGAKEQKTIKDWFGDHL